MNKKRIWVKYGQQFNITIMITFQKVDNSFVLIENTSGDNVTRATIPINNIVAYEVSDDLIGVGAPNLYFLVSYDEILPAVNNWNDFINLTKDIFYI